MSASVRVAIAVAACSILTACAETTGTTSEGDCVSKYDIVSSAPTWADLQDALLGRSDGGRVASVRIQPRGDDVGAGDQVVVRVVDLLSRRGRRLVQVDVWRTDDGAWRAGVWSQCID